MGFDDADAYDAFMGRYSVGLGPQLADLAGVAAGQRALDVGCGSGALTRELIDRLGTSCVSAADPSVPFVSTMRQRFPGLDVRHAAAESMPFSPDTFDASLAQLVVHFMSDPIVGLREMARVTCPDGVVAACVWDHSGGQGPLGAFWRAARELAPGIHDESALPGARQGHLTELFTAAGLRDVEETALSVDVEHPSFEEWWGPFTRGVGPAGAYVASLDPAAQETLRERCEATLPPAPFVVTAVAWAARGRP